MLGTDLEVPCCGSSNEHPQHTFSWRNKDSIIMVTPLSGAMGFTVCHVAALLDT